jgi:transglutaminase-like putative cysteine protease
MRRLAIGIALLFCASLAGAADGPPIDIRLHLAVLHPEVFGGSDFKNWEKSGHKLAGWREEKPTATHEQAVVVQNVGPKNASDMLALNVQLDGEAKVIEALQFAAPEVSVSYQAAEKRVRDELKVDVVGGAPRVDFASPVPLGWQMTLEGNGGIVEVRGSDIASAVRPGEAKTDCAAGEGDALSQNDLHHPRDPGFAVKAISLVHGITDPDERAKALFDYVRINYVYGTNLDADSYIDSDELTRSRGWGACDEKAVILITFLRAVGISARLKLLRWIRGGESPDDTYSHASVEYVVNNVVHCLDPTFNYIDRPEMYRTLIVDGLPVTNVRVVDADWPSDARSTDPVGKKGLPDTDIHDGRLNPWKDFCYWPSIDGNERPGYSK